MPFPILRRLFEGSQTNTPTVAPTSIEQPFWEKHAYDYNKDDYYQNPNNFEMLLTYDETSEFVSVISLNPASPLPFTLKYSPKDIFDINGCKPCQTIGKIVGFHGGWYIGWTELKNIPDSERNLPGHKFAYEVAIVKNRLTQTQIEAVLHHGNNKSFVLDVPDSSKFIPNDYLLLKGVDSIKRKTKWDIIWNIREQEEKYHAVMAKCLPCQRGPCRNSRQYDNMVQILLDEQKQEQQNHL